jgi:hypothetical protein
MVIGRLRIRTGGGVGAVQSRRTESRMGVIKSGMKRCDGLNRPIGLRWAALLRRIYDVDPLRCPTCGTQMRVISFILRPSVIDRILAHIRDKGRDPSAGPWANAAA